MPLDIVQIVAQIEALAGELKTSQRAREERLQFALNMLRSPDMEIKSLKERIASSKTTWLIAEPQERLDLSYEVPPSPAEFVVIAADGSHIDVDRHSPARCYLINIGSAVLQYGKDSSASLTSQPSLYSGEDLVIADPAGSNRQAFVEGPLLGIKRSVAECHWLAGLARDLTGKLPVLALLDGSLILWGLSGQDVPEFVKQEILEDGFLNSLDRLKEIGSRRRLALASYISFPRSTDVVNTMRIALCPDQPVDCDHCRSDNRSTSERRCEAVAGLQDSDLFRRLLSPGERSVLFRNRSKIIERYRRHHIFFFYIRVGEEIARVELPQWVAGNKDLLDLVHALVFDQCQRGQGYPVALIEAHEKAVLTGADREQFWHLVELALTRSNLSTRTSAKSQSKRTRWI